MRNRLPFRKPQLVVLLAITASALCLAQSANPMYRVTVTHVKPDMLDEWQDLQRHEVIPALKKAGVKTQTVYRTYFGDPYEFVTVVPFDKYADFDNPAPITKGLEAAALARLQARTRKCIVSTNSYVNTRLADLSNIPDTPPEVLVVSRYRITQGKMQDFQNLVKSDVLPLYVKAKAYGIVSQRGFGANPNDVTMTSGYAKMADLDLGPVMTRQLGAEAAAKVNAKFQGIRTPVDRMVRRRVADLSF